VSVRFTNYAWQRVERFFQSGSFDVTLVLGNSLCLLREQESRRAAARNFRAICKAGGTLVVDERNFDYILRERRRILEGNFRYSARVMYCGTSIQGRPDVIEDNHVRFVYEDVKKRKALGHLDMHPFKRGELVELFRTAGFASAEVFSDFQPGYRDSADFFTYVFR
jgi:SAM-dependent methyltransferase